MHTITLSIYTTFPYRYFLIKHTSSSLSVTNVCFAFLRIPSCDVFYYHIFVPNSSKLSLP